MAVDPRLMIGLANASPKLIRLFQTLVNKRGYDPNLLAENVMPDSLPLQDPWVSNGSYLNHISPNFANETLGDYTSTVKLQNTQPYLKDISDNTIANGFPSVNRRGPTMDQLEMYANRPDLLERYYGDRGDIYATAMRLGSQDLINSGIVDPEANQRMREYYEEPPMEEFDDITGGSPFGIDDFTSDDNPDDKLAILARKLIMGR